MGQSEPTQHDVTCGEPGCGAKMRLRPSKHGWFYGCARYPACTGTHGAHADGRPKGIPADKPTREARMRAHAALDPMWKNDRRAGEEASDARGRIYRWMQRVMGMTEDEAHIGRFTVAQCDELIEHVRAAYQAKRERDGGTHE